MIQRFIELGEGYSDLYELIELARNNKHRLMHMIALHSSTGSRSVTSLAVILSPTDPGNFQPIYICREGIPHPHDTPNKRFDLFKETAETLNQSLIEMDVKSSAAFAETELYFQYLIGILRLNHLLAPMD
ncbi:methylthioribose kinase [Bacillus aerolatus]|uniref:Methylthioribose kinase n=1 Tax=Bacillus aerolatus TaxID=2653354 RepID=A0A6I1FHT1_9BACI|nr:methylthioribose kinase [Bacillus aerolatus]KAB7707950.1 methylthioribose kinase [Bacillus aerolatus]